MPATATELVDRRRYGEIDVRAIVDRHIVDHVERHVTQLEQILDARRA